RLRCRGVRGLRAHARGQGAPLRRRPHRRAPAAGGAGPAGVLARRRRAQAHRARGGDGRALLHRHARHCDADPPAHRALSRRARVDAAVRRARDAALQLRGEYSMSMSRDLAKVALDVTYDRLPADVVLETKRFILDTLACAIGGFHSPAGTMTRELAAEMGG